MNSTFKSMVLLITLTFVFLILFMLPSILLPVSEAVTDMMNAEEMKWFFPLLLLFALYQSTTFWLLLKNSNESAMKLFLTLAPALFVLYPLMGLLESLFWQDAFKGMETNEFFKVFYRFTMTYLLFAVYLVMVVAPKKTEPARPKEPMAFKILLQKIVLIALIYFVVYNLFGYFVAWQFEATRVFYTGSAEMKGFFAAMLENVSDLSFVLMHLFRGLLFGVAGYLFYRIFSTTKGKMMLIMAFIFGGFGFQIVLPNPFFPEMVRISHFVETTSSMIVFGVLVAYVLSRNSQKHTVAQKA